MNRHTIVWLLGLTVTLVLGGCKPSVPSDVLSRGDMEDVLYDWHLSQSLAEQQGDRGEAERIYEDAVLRKYGITRQQFDHSLSYYMRHTEELTNIYTNLEERLKNEASSLGASAGTMGRFGSVGTSGDTARVWSENKSLVLMTKAPFNQYSFSIKCDSAFHAGDALTLNFDCDFIYQDGTRSACALLAITLANDSVVSTFTQLSMPCHQTLNLADYHRVGIKAVRGYFMLSKSQSELESQTTLQLMFVNNIQLIRMHTKAEPQDSSVDTMTTQPVHLDAPLPKAASPMTAPQHGLKHVGPLKPEDMKVVR